MNHYFFKIFIFAVLLSTGCNQTHRNKGSEYNTENVYSGPIIDMHMHAYEDGASMLGLAHPPTLRDQVFQGVETAEELKEQVLEKFREYNIVKAVVTNGQIWKTDFPDQILIADSNKPIDSLRNMYQNGQLHVIGEMSPFYAGIRANDPSQLPFFGLAEELGIPVGFHVLPGGPNYGFHHMPEMLGGMRVYNADPMQLEEVLVKFPDLKIYIMHGGWPYVEDVKALLYAHPDVYVDIAVINWILPREEMYTYLKSLINAGFGNRIMYGSDQMVWPQTIDIAIETINSADFLTIEQKEDIFYDNAAEFLGLSFTYWRCRTD
jgi:uncharacterized protein